MANNPRFNKYQIGRGSYGKPSVISWDNESNLIIGQFCSIADDVTILLGGEHHTEWVTTYPFSEFIDEAKHIKGHPFSRGDVVIENDVWIGNGALIRSGVHIYNGAVIGARSVVTKNVAPYSIVAGNPARHIRFRFPEPTIKALQDISWWNMPLSEIKDIIPLLLSSDVQLLLDKYPDKMTEATKLQFGNIDKITEKIDINV